MPFPSSTPVLSGAATVCRRLTCCGNSCVAHRMSDYATAASVLHACAWVLAGVGGGGGCDQQAFQPACDAGTQGVGSAPKGGSLPIMILSPVHRNAATKSSASQSFHKALTMHLFVMHLLVRSLLFRLPIGTLLNLEVMTLSRFRLADTLGSVCIWVKAL